jgi:hypothetical protein
MHAMHTPCTRHAHAMHTPRTRHPLIVHPLIESQVLPQLQTPVAEDEPLGKRRAKQAVRWQHPNSLADEGSDDPDDAAYEPELHVHVHAGPGGCVRVAACTRRVAACARRVAAPARRVAASSTQGCSPSLHVYVYVYLRRSCARARGGEGEGEGESAGRGYCHYLYRHGERRAGSRARAEGQGLHRGA